MSVDAVGVPAAEDLAQYKAFAENLAREAGVIARTFFDGNRPSTRKADNSYLTEADTQINDLVIARVKKAYPSHDIIGEEASYGTGSMYVWVCDPIDGTAPFVMGLPYSCFELALVVDGVPVVAVIYDLMGDRMYVAVKDQGATLDGIPIRVSTNSDMNLATLVISSTSSVFVNAVSCRAALSDVSHRIISLQCTSRDATLVAAGFSEAGLFLGPNVHDVAAPKLLVEEAGGFTSDLHGNEQRYDKPVTGMIFSNGVMHHAILDIVKQNFL